MKKLLFCTIIVSSISVLGMHEEQGPFAYALYKKLQCYAGYCTCEFGICKNKKKLIPQEKIEETARRMSGINRLLRN